MLKYETVLFDLDGTLIDTNELIITTFLHVLGNRFPGRFNREDVTPHMGQTLYEQMERFGGPALCEELMVEYRAHNDLIHDEQIKSFLYVNETLGHLKNLGVTMGIVTTKQRRTAERGAFIFGIEPYMKTFITYESTENHKPDPAPVLKAMEVLTANPATTIMVGDSQYDIEAAQRSGIDSAGVAWSLKGADFLKRFNPTYILQDMRDIIPIVNGELSHA